MGITIKIDIARAVAKSAKINLDQAIRSVDTVFETLKESVKQGNGVEIRGFGSFLILDRKAIAARNPKTGVPCQIPSGKRVKFRPGKELKAIINSLEAR